MPGHSRLPMAILLMQGMTKMNPSPYPIYQRMQHKNKFSTHTISVSPSCSVQLRYYGYLIQGTPSLGVMRVICCGAAVRSTQISCSLFSFFCHSPCCSMRLRVFQYLLSADMMSIQLLHWAENSHTMHTKMQGRLSMQCSSIS